MSLSFSRYTPSCADRAAPRPPVLGGFWRGRLLRLRTEASKDRSSGSGLAVPPAERLSTLAEGAHVLSLRDYHALRAHADIAPVTKQSGKSRQVLMRYRCSQRLHNAFYHWARASIQHDPRSKHHYARLRQVGHIHGRASDPNRRSKADVTAA
jgi:transposase